MITITNEDLIEASMDYARVELGQAQFDNNKDAVESISTNFIDGCRFILHKYREDPEIMDTTQPDYEG